MSAPLETSGPLHRLWLQVVVAMAIALGPILTAAAQLPKATQGDKSADSGHTSVGDLIGSIEKLREASPPPGSKSDEEDAFELSRNRKIVAAADRLLNERLAADQTLVAIRAKLEALNKLSQLGDDNAPAQAREFLKQAEERYNQLPNVARYVLDLRLIAAVRGTSGEQTPEKAREYWAKLQRLIAHGQPVQSDRRLAILIGMLLEDTGQSKLAAEAYREFATFFRRSNADWASSAADELDASVRLLTLEGQRVEIKGALTNGKPFNIDSYRGRVVLVDFWATWCGPCVAELEHLKEVYSRYHGKGLEIVGVNLDDSRQSLLGFLAERPLPWPVLHDEPADRNEDGHPLAKHYGIRALPTLILVDRQGRVVSTHARGEELRRLLKDLLGPADK